jgi:hypothetical protein
MLDKNEPSWEEFTTNTWRLKVEGGHIYHNVEDGGNSMCFVPDVDLTRYQAHLRDAYNQGFKDGSGEIRMEPNTTAYNRGFKDGKAEIDLSNPPIPRN